jgi:hypothetical protein
VKFLAREMDRLGVAICLDTVVDTEFIAGLDADVVNVATGARPTSLQLPVADKTMSNLPALIWHVKRQTHRHIPRSPPW